MAKFGFIGMGNMGYAILKGLLKKYEPKDMVFSEINEERGQRVWKETGVSFVKSSEACVKEAKYLVLAVKPQYYDGVLMQIRDFVNEDHIVITIAPGIERESVKKALGGAKKIVRAMPNTPALVGEGMSGVCYEEGLYSEEEKAVIADFFGSFGKMERVEEGLMDAVGSLSGCSPAYVYMLIEAMADGGVKYGLPRAKAYEMAAQTVLGSAKMVLETGKHPGELKDMVCSPAGTTIAGVSALEEYGFRNAILKAIDASYEKTLKMREK
ncbi:MAG: pyrroline-5-carboxylate reductase [bacterium]|nr:pyrroline-5-carboxylate reductase [bacterium]